MDSPRNPEAVMAHVALGEYSPIVLRGLPQPVPKDIQHYMDPSVFGFEAAFEDLLTVSHGQPLPDISNVYKLRANLRDRFPAGEPVFLFLRRLRAGGLLHTPNPQAYPKNDPRAVIEFTHQQAERQVEDFWGSASDLKKHPDPEDISALMKATVKTWEWKTKEMAEGREKWSRALKEQGPGPDSEGDLIDAIESRFGGRETTWDTFKKSLSEDPKKWTAWDETSGQDHHVVTKREHVDPFGLHHTTTTIKLFDKDRNQIGTKVTHTVASVGTDNENHGKHAANCEQDKQRSSHRWKFSVVWGKD